MEKYIVIKNNLIENFILAETPPTPQSGETILLASDYPHIKDIKTPYDSVNNIFLTKFKGIFKYPGEEFTSLTSSITLSYNTAITEITESNITIKGDARIENFSTNITGSDFDLILNEELINSSSSDEIIELTVDQSITDINGYTTIVNPLKMKYISGSL